MGAPSSTMANAGRCSQKEEKAVKKLLAAVAALAAITFSPFVLAKTYVAGIEPSFPPWASVKSGQYVGIAPDAVRAIAKVEGIDVKFVSMSFPSLIPALKAGKIDIIVTGLSVTPKRAQQIDYTIPWWETKLDVLVKKDSKYNIVTALCCGSDVGAQTGSTEYQWLQDHLIKQGVKITPHAYAEDTTALQDLRTGRLKATVTDADTGQAFVQANNDVVRIAGQIYHYPPESYALAVQKGDPDGLLPKLNEGILKIYQSGKWADIVHEYIPGASIIPIPAYMSDKVPSYHKPIPGLSEAQN
jgi:polar amino acid transport system substrate-binding protein